MCALIIYTTFVLTLLILRITERDLIKNTYCLNVKYLLFLSHFNEIWGFLDRFSKNTQISIFMEILPVAAEWFQVGGFTDGETDMKKLTAILRYFEKAP